MKKILSIFRGMTVLFLALLLLLNLWLLASRFLLHKDLPKLFGYSHAVVLSGSMEPTFSPGDLLVFQEKERYHVEDVVVFRQGSSLVTHRIVAETPDGFFTQGDANNTEDQDLLDPTQIEGILVWILPEVGNVMTFLISPLGILTLIMTGFLLIKLSHVWEKQSRKRGDPDA